MDSTTITIAVLSVIVAAYYFKVPGDHHDLGNLHQSPKGPFPQDFWPEHGYVELAHGPTHYYLLGPKDGKKLVFVHGITSPPPTIATFLEKLAAKGYRVLCYGNGI
jgi:hypothetical protein